MWIRSQDLKALVNVQNIEMDGECEIWGFGNATLLGKYSTKEKALKVLDDIEHSLEYPYNTVFQMPQDDEISMIPKEIREKIEQKLKIDKEIKEWLSENSCVQYGEIFWEYAEIVDKPKGTEQDNGEYCSQSTDGYDNYWGHYYYPLDNGKYLKVYYEC